MRIHSYEDGKIFKIIDKDNNIIFLGQTIQELRYRWWTLHCNSKAHKELAIWLQNNDSSIELIEKWPCNNAKELKIRCQFWRDKLI